MYTINDINMSSILISATYESMYSVPGWLVFPNNIINTSHIINIERNKIHPNVIYISTVFATNSICIEVTNSDATWNYLQNIFTQGIKKL